jgi:hypothetical protein
MSAFNDFMSQTDKLTLKQKEILVLLYRFRFLNRHHIQNFLKHSHSPRINTWLKYLSEKNYIHRIYSRKFAQNTIPAVYFLKTKSAGMLKQEKDVNKTLLPRIYREHLRSDQFVDNCLFLADIYFHLKKLCKENKTDFQFFTRTDLAEHSYLPNPLPDLYFTVNESRAAKRYFMDMYAKKTPRYVLQHRILRFFNYYVSNSWEKTTGHPFPAVLLVCPDKYILGYLNKFISETMEEEDNFEIRFFLATKGNIRKEGVGVKVWKTVS